jgi:hypothetical protein
LECDLLEDWEWDLREGRYWWSLAKKSTAMIEMASSSQSQNTLLFLPNTNMHNYD